MVMLLATKEASQPETRLSRLAALRPSVLSTKSLILSINVGGSSTNLLETSITLVSELFLVIPCLAIRLSNEPLLMLIAIILIEKGVAG